MSGTRADVPATTQLLKAWAAGSRPAMAAVDFLIATGQVGRAMSCGLVLTEEHHDGTRVAYVTHHDSWVYSAGVYSSGERAILHLAASLHHGELDEYLWSLDGTNRAAFTDAITQAGRR